jgi:hypothetical protein
VLLAGREVAASAWSLPLDCLFRTNLHARIVLIGLALAAFAVLELSGIKTEVQKFSAINDNTSRVLEVAKRIEMIRRANLRFTIDADEAATKESAEAETSAIELLKASADAPPSEERRTIYNGLRSDVDTLRKKRDDLPTSSWPCSSRPSTSLLRLTFLGVDARDKRGHDESLIVSLGISC